MRICESIDPKWSPEWFDENGYPHEVTQDRRGTTIEVGSRVAFNHSGDIAIGIIRELKKCEWERMSHDSQRWQIKFELHIEREDGGISKVKNPNSFVII